MRGEVGIRMDAVEEGKMIANVQNLMDWRETFERDIREVKGEMKDLRVEVSGVRDDIHEVGTKLDTVLEIKEQEKQEAKRSTPTWVKWGMGIFATSVLTIAGWFVEWAIFHH